MLANIFFRQLPESFARARLRETRINSGSSPNRGFALNCSGWLPRALMRTSLGLDKPDLLPTPLVLLTSMKPVLVKAAHSMTMASNTPLLLLRG